MVHTSDPSRPRGLLNERERQYLLGQADIEPRSQTERDIRATIRTRLQQALYDFALLYDHLEDRDIAQVFDSNVDEVAELRTAIEETVGFFYRATINFHPPFPQLAKEGIQRAEQQHFDRHVKATIDVEPTAPIDPAVIKQKMTQDQASRLTSEEATWVAETVIASEDFSFDKLAHAHEQLRERHAGLDDATDTDTDPDT